ncbi:creatinine amidohydrolase [Arthrobacter crystallopoietes]|uniref:Creatinine amidohydrolase n=2 Tax=Crystallibacter crystallopoietes TaxID=37928 RepID=A0A1H1AZ74_9MICC|nr:creatininase [Arthrobacter crystallopoietes]SDQ44496.1 creatinine amidohydrolase [Arthrobacter crystallopoietes]
MRNSVYMEELDSFTYREKISDGKAAVLVPVGSIEQHGPHMPLNVDVLLSRAMAGSVAEAVGGLVAAPITYGYKSQQRSGGGNHIPGTTSLDASTVISIARTLTLEFARHGVRKIAFINGHFENYQFLYEGVDLAVTELQRAGINDVKVMLLSYWDFVDEATIAELYPDGFTGWDLEHGGVLETSLMLHLYPEKVEMDKVEDLPPAVLPNYDVLPVRPELTPASGCLSSAAQATATKGEILLKRASVAMSAALDAEFQDVIDNDVEQK